MPQCNHERCPDCNPPKRRKQGKWPSTSVHETLSRVQRFVERQGYVVSLSLSKDDAHYDRNIKARVVLSIRSKANNLGHWVSMPVTVLNGIVYASNAVIPFPKRMRGWDAAGKLVMAVLTAQG